MSKPSIVDDVPEIVQETIQRARRNIARISAERLGMGTRCNEEPDAATAPDRELLDEFRRMCARKGIGADAVIAFLSKDE